MSSKGQAGSAPMGISDLDAMALALAEARQAGEAGEVPVGAVVVIDGEVVAQAGNRRERDSDPTAHAELLALRAAAAVNGLVAARGGDAGGQPRALPDVRGSVGRGPRRPARVRRRQHRQRGVRHALQPLRRPSTQPRGGGDPRRGGRAGRRRCSTTSSPPAAADPLVTAPGRRVAWSTESCQSGRMGRSRKPLWLSGHRGFESHALRHVGESTDATTGRRSPALRNHAGVAFVGSS